MTPITDDIGFQREEGKVVYYLGHLPVFQHEEKDLRSFRLFTSQPARRSIPGLNGGATPFSRHTFSTTYEGVSDEMVVNGTVRQMDIVRAFQVPLGTVKRYTKLYRKQGAEGFFRPLRRRRGATVLTPEVVQRVQKLLDAGKSASEVEQEVGPDLIRQLRLQPEETYLPAMREFLLPTQRRS